MAALDIYTELKGWQTAIGSLMGFLALLTGALWNYRLNRRRDALLRKEEMISVAVALYGEMVALRRELAQFATMVSNRYHTINTERTTLKIDSHFLAVLPELKPMLYEALASKLGMLEPPLVLGITQFYGKLRDARESISLLLPDETRGYAWGASIVLKPAVEAVKEAVPTLRRIEKLAGISTPAPEELELGQSEFVLDIESN